MKSRLYCAIICYVLSFILLCICIPITKKIMYPKADGIRVVHGIDQGEQIQRDDIEVVRIGTIGLSDGIIETPEDVIGRYAKVDIVAEDLLFDSKISQLPLDGDHPKDILPSGQKAILIRLKMIEGSEYPMPETGDIVRLNHFDKKLTEIPTLQFVRILSVLPEQEDYIEVTIAVNEEQWKYTRKHQEDVFYGSVIVRSNEELAEKLLQEQDSYFKEGD